MAAVSEKSFVTTAVAGLFQARRARRSVPLTNSATAVQPAFRFHALAVTVYVPSRGTVKRSAMHWLTEPSIGPGWQDSSPGWIVGYAAPRMNTLVSAHGDGFTLKQGEEELSFAGPRSQ